MALAEVQECVAEEQAPPGWLKLRNSTLNRAISPPLSAVVSER